MTVLALLGLASVSCTSFQREWRAKSSSLLVAGGASSATEVIPEGLWEGAWHSVSTGHSGKLRAIISPPKSAPKPALIAERSGPKSSGRADVHYHATWGVFSGAFRTTHDFGWKSASGRRVSQARGIWPLPEWAGGDYDYTVTVDGDKYRATYRSAMDHGTFEMNRLRAGASGGPSAIQQKPAEGRGVVSRH